MLFYGAEDGFAHRKQHGPQNSQAQAAIIPFVTVENAPVVEVNSILEHEHMIKHYSFVQKQALSWNIQDAKGVYYVRIRCHHPLQVWPHPCRAPTITITDDLVNTGYLLAEFNCRLICGVLQFQISGRGDLATEETSLQFEMSGEQNSPPQPLAKYSSTGLFLLSLQWESRLHGDTTTKPSQGTIQFLDSILVRFQGTMDLDVVGETVYIEGFKIGHVPAEQTGTEWQKRMRWGEFWSSILKPSASGSNLNYVVPMVIPN